MAVPPTTPILNNLKNKFKDIFTMSNSNTEHSKKLRAKTAAAHIKKNLALGLIRRMMIQAPTPVADEFDTICKELELSRPKALEYLCKFYRDHNN